MINGFLNFIRLARAGALLAWHGVHVVPDDVPAPWPARLFRRFSARFQNGGEQAEQAARLSKALAALGPSYIKAGQFLATRRDIIGPNLAAALGRLQDRLPPFSMEETRRAIRESLGAEPEALYASLSEPVAAASIAQVHKGTVRQPDGSLKPMAVKILRPGVEASFRRDLGTFYFAARQAERFHPPFRRLRPLAIVDTLAEWVRLEMDLRLEAAAMSEMAENIARAGDTGFRVPKIDWTRTSARVMTSEWIDAIPMNDLAAIDAAGLDREALGNHVIRSFLRHAMRDGFFHADMHQGNLFVDPDGTLVAVDFGIMGRLGPKEKRFLAEILYGFLTRDYLRTARMHLEAGYVPPRFSVEAFAQALRSIGEPLMDRTAEEISMARLLSQLFEVTELFDMQTRPELLLLQKTMVVVEGVARSLDPKLNIWTAAEPVVKNWMEEQIGPRARINEGLEGVSAIAGLLTEAPKLAAEARRMSAALAETAENGLHLDQSSIERIADAQSARSWPTRAALWIGALAMVTIAIKFWQ
jgi:ubiquinone biosynthesis protein